VISYDRAAAQSSGEGSSGNAGATRVAGVEAGLNDFVFREPEEPEEPEWHEP